MFANNGNFVFGYALSIALHLVVIYTAGILANVNVQ
jgi:hypothetical protein